MKQYDTVALLAFASGVAQQAGEVMLQYFYRDDKQVVTKDDKSPVTIADTTINRMLIEAVATHYPEHGVLGEEASRHSDRAELWVCDPIDGTRGFIYGDPTAMFSLAFVVEGEPLVAVAYDPFQDKLFSAIQGQGAQCNGQPVQVSAKQPTAADIVVAGPGGMAELEEGLPMYRALRAQGVQVRLLGGGVFKMALVADGHVDGRIFPGKYAHDVAAMKLIIEEAGGRVTDIFGEDQPYNGTIRGAIASNGHVHEMLVAVVRKHGAEMIAKHQA